MKRRTSAKPPERPRTNRIAEKLTYWRIRPAGLRRLEILRRVIDNTGVSQSEPKAVSEIRARNNEFSKVYQQMNSHGRPDCNIGFSYRGDCLSARPRFQGVFRRSHLPTHRVSPRNSACLAVSHVMSSSERVGFSGCEISGELCICQLVKRATPMLNWDDEMNHSPSG